MRGRRRLLTFLIITTAIAAVGLARQEPETLIRGGDVMTPDGLRTVDIRVLGSTITEIGPELATRDDASTVIDARDRVVLPGGVDPHVHLGGNRVDDYTSGSAAALAGGITTISNFGGVRADESLARVRAAGARANPSSPTLQLGPRADAGLTEEPR